MIERNNFTKFLSEFYGTMLELAPKEGDIIPLATFDELKMDLFLSNIQREHYVQGSDEPAKIAIPEDKSLISILKIKVTPKSINEFFMLFREFARRNLIAKESDWEVEERYREYERQEIEYVDIAREEMERKLDYDRLIEYGKEYAKLNCLLTNIERNIANPYIFKDEDYQKFHNEYVSIFQDRFKDIINQRLIDVEDTTCHTNRIVEVVGKISDKVLKDKLIKQLKDIENQIEINPNFTLNPMRVTLEGVIKEVCIKNNIPVLEKGNRHPRSLTVLQRALKINELSKEISYLINMGNTGSHYDILHSFITIDETEAKELFNILLFCLEFIIKKFDI